MDFKGFKIEHGEDEFRNGVKGRQYHMKHTHTKRELEHVYLNFKYALYFTFMNSRNLSIKSKEQMIPLSFVK